MPPTQTMAPSMCKASGSVIEIIGVVSYVFRRCPRKVGAICDTTPPPEHDAGDGHVIACHIPLDVLRRIEPVFARARETASAPA